MSNPVRPQRWQPTRLHHPWDSPGKNTGVGCHFLLQCMKVKSERSHLVVSDSLQPHGLQPTRLLRPWDFLGKSTGVGCYCLLWELILKAVYSQLRLLTEINQCPLDPGYRAFLCGQISNTSKFWESSEDTKKEGVFFSRHKVWYLAIRPASLTVGTATF